MITDEDIYEHLEHFGVAGMRWGVRNPKNRELNKASRKKDVQEHNKAVDKARAEIRTGQHKQEWKQAKAQYKKDKVTLGSREARKILNKTREQQYNRIEKSQQAKSGKETAIVLLAAAGLIGLGALARAR